MEKSKSVPRRRICYCSLIRDSVLKFFSMMQIEERAFRAKDIYAECIQLLTDGKLSTKNAFEVDLIENLEGLFDCKKNDVDRANCVLDQKRRREVKDNGYDTFLKASCSLEASSKIYAFRCDKVLQDTFATVLITKGLENTDDDSETGEPDRKKAKKGLATLEKNKKNISTDFAFDLDLQVQDDPFFDKITKLFDPSNIDGSLQSNLPTDSEGKMLLDGTEPAFIYKSEKMRTFSESSQSLTNKLRPAEISSRLVEFRMPLLDRWAKPLDLDCKYRTEAPRRSLTPRKIPPEPKIEESPEVPEPEEIFFEVENEPPSVRADLALKLDAIEDKTRASDFNFYPSHVTDRFKFKKTKDKLEKKKREKEKFRYQAEEIRDCEALFPSYCNIEVPDLKSWLNAGCWIRRRMAETFGSECRMPDSETEEKPSCNPSQQSGPVVETLKLASRWLCEKSQKHHSRKQRNCQSRKPGMINWLQYNEMPKLVRPLDVFTLLIRPDIYFLQQGTFAYHDEPIRHEMSLLQACRQSPAAESLVIPSGTDGLDKDPEDGSEFLDKNFDETDPVQLDGEDKWGLLFPEFAEKMEHTTGEYSVPYSTSNQYVDIKTLMNVLWESVERKSTKVSFEEMLKELQIRLSGIPLSIPVCFVCILYLCNEKYLQLRDWEAENLENTEILENLENSDEHRRQESSQSSHILPIEKTRISIKDMGDYMDSWRGDFVVMRQPEAS